MISSSALLHYKPQSTLSAANKARVKSKPSRISIPTPTMPACLHAPAATAATPQKSSKGILPWRDASCSLRSTSSADFSATASVSFVVVVALDGHDRFVGFTFLFYLTAQLKVRLLKGILPILQVHPLVQRMETHLGPTPIGNPAKPWLELL